MSAPERLSCADMAEDIRRMAASKADWLETFSNGPKKRPDYEIQTQRKHLGVLQQAAEDYQRAAERPDAPEIRMRPDR
ncbi:hypothetical protein GGQ64_002595 [Rhizobium azooxidifex]|uniref:Uncharacterized protein n=1 Tax=Mycoplana azooxidifex TaxID=1636188 RepID=A0A7W6GKZ0_9HYPH|nr:hypothetical protein [Mycoplana azooxidifex]MBB3977389.1 hypothetical protein [Mycoplana azooxidifex]